MLHFNGDRDQDALKDWMYQHIWFYCMLVCAVFYSVSIKMEHSFKPHLSAFLKPYFLFLD